MNIWGSFYKVESTNLGEALSTIGLTGYEPTSFSCSFSQAFFKTTDDNVFITITKNNYLVMVDINYSLIGSNYSFERQQALAATNSVAESFKIYYDNNESITSFLKTSKGELVRFVFDWPGVDSKLFGDPVPEESRHSSTPLPADSSLHSKTMATIENILFKVFGKWYYSEFGDLEEVELHEFRRNKG